MVQKIIKVLLTYQGKLIQHRVNVSTLMYFLWFISKKLPNKLADIWHSQPDTIIALAGAHNGKLFTIGQDQLVVYQRLAPGYGQLFVT